MNNNDEKPTPQQESIRDAQLRIALLVGQPDNGKSFIANLLVDLGRLVHRKRVFLGDGEEGTNLVFTRTAPRRIKPLKLETEQEVEGLVTTMENGGFTHALLDTAGSSQRPIRRACGDFGDLTESEVVILPIIVVGSRDGADRVAIDWLKIVHALPRIYWVWNNQRYDEDDSRKLPEDLDQKVGKAVRHKIVEVRLPALRDDIAKEITRLGTPPSRVAAGQVPDSVLLSHRNVRGKVARWFEETRKALEPLLTEFPTGAASEDDATGKVEEPNLLGK